MQLTGAYVLGRGLDLPDRVDGIPVGRKCRRLHFLHGTAWAGVDKGRHIGSYVVHYTDGREEEIAIRYGEDVENWWWGAKSHLENYGAPLAWLGTNSATGDANRLRLYAMTWDNPFRDTAIARLDFVSTRSPSCPFLLAVTSE